MRWIKINTEADLPKDENKEVVVKASIGNDLIADIADLNRIKNFISNGWKVEWLDEEAINKRLEELEKKIKELESKLPRERSFCMDYPPLIDRGNKK